MSSARLAVRLTTCSTTPRSGRRFAEELAHTYGVPAHHQVYEEAKLALVALDTGVAKTLFEQCPLDYRHTETYIRQCAQLHALCAAGVVRRPETKPLRCVLADVLAVTMDHQSVGCYAERLDAAGYSATAVNACTLWDLDDLCAVLEPSVGHRARLRAFLAARTPWWQAVGITLVHSVRKCGGIHECVATAVTAASALKPKESKA